MKFFVFLCLLFSLSASASDTILAVGDELIPQTEFNPRCYDDCCDKDCEPMRVKCKAYVKIYDKECGFPGDDDALTWCEKIAEFWDLPFLPILCSIFPDPANTNLLCAEYGPDQYAVLVGSGKKSVLKKFNSLIEHQIYNGYFSAEVCIEFEKYCKSY